MSTTTRANALPPGLPKLKRPATRDHLQSKPPPWRIIDVCLDPALANARDEARRTRHVAETQTVDGENSEARATRLAKLRKEEEDATQKAEDASVQILAVSPGRTVKDDLLNLPENQPTEEQQEKAKAEGGQVQFNPDTFPFSLIAATVKVPEMTAEEWIATTKNWNTDEYVKLWLAVQEVNGTSHLVSLGNGSSGIRG